MRQAIAVEACEPAYPQQTARPRTPLSRAKRAAVDWCGLWFKVGEELGEYVGMRGGLRVGDRITWMFPSHADYDGLGGFVHVLRESHPGRAFAVPVRKSRAPSWGTRAMALLRMLRRPTVPAAGWKGHDIEWQGRRTGPGQEFATAIWDAAQTKRLLAKARSHGLSLNSLLMHALAEASRADLDDGIMRWMMPVNMRGPVKLARDTSNQTGYLQIEIPSGSGPAAVQDALKAALGRRDHWASWMFLNLSRYVGMSGTRRLFRAQMDRYRQRPFVGAFTNLGAWTGVGLWSVAPPVTKTCPVSVGAIICDGKLSLTVEAHPAIRREDGWTQAFMDRWTALLQS